MKLKKIKDGVVKLLLSAIPIITVAVLTISANSVASPTNWQPTPPASLKKYRKF